MTRFYSTATGAAYDTEDPVEIARLTVSRSHRLTPGEEPTVEDSLFHPKDHTVADVINYLSEHPEHYNRVVAEEKAGANRKGIVGDEGTGE